MSFDINDVQPTMRKLVTWLRAAGFETTDSGDGVTNVEAGMEGALTEPHVFILLANYLSIIRQADRLQRLVVEYGFSIGYEEGEVYVEAMYSPYDGISTLALWGATDETMEKCER